MNLQRYLTRRQQQVDRYLERCFPPAKAGDRLTEAMRYSLFSGGKRIRPILALAANEAVGAQTTALLPFACALELIHTYSLIHDDLPSMDDDALRRGRPTSHIVFGEGMAILAGDGLLTEAFRIMADATLKAGSAQGRALQVLSEIARAAGAHGMVAGKAADMGAENTVIDLPTVEWIHVRKTGALIRAAVRAGALLGAARNDQLRRLTRYAEFLGLAFQLADDVLDAEGTTAMTGKVTGRDRVRRKATFPAVLGLSATKERARELLTNAFRELRAFDEHADPLRAIASFIVGRACAS